MSRRPRIAVTGANGFVGAQVVRLARERGHLVTALVRAISSSHGWLSCDELRVETVGDLASSRRLADALTDADVLIHAAGRAHIMQERAADPLAAFRSSNVHGTEHLTREATRAGVKRMVFVSTIKVNGDHTERAPFREDDLPRPTDPYAISKWEAEQLLWRLAEETGLEVCVVRPPLVYGPGVRANFLQLMRWVDSGFPLPFASIHNRRSMIAVSNLVDLLLTCAIHPKAAGELFLASDEQGAPSTGELAAALGVALGKRGPLLPVPAQLLFALGGLAGRRQQVERLCDSLEIDSGKARRMLEWRSPRTMAQELADTASWYRSRAVPDSDLRTRV